MPFIFTIISFPSLSSANITFFCLISSFIAISLVAATGLLQISSLHGIAHVFPLKSVSFFSHCIHGKYALLTSIVDDRSSSFHDLKWNEVAMGFFHFFLTNYAYLKFFTSENSEE